jgi:hypothetical protein
MATDWASAKQLQDNINLIEDILLQNGPNYEDREFYQQMLEEQYEELRNVQQRQATTNTQLPDSYMNLSAPQPGQPVSPASSSGASRKRSLGHSAMYPESKRPSMNPSPISSNTPNSINSDPPAYQLSHASSSRQLPLPQVSARNQSQGYAASSYRQTTLPYGQGRPQAPSNVIDLTESNTPTPDPFPELNSAFMPGVPRPGDAFQQDFMPEHELAQFLIAPTPAGAGYAFQPTLVQQQVKPEPIYGAYEVPEVPLYIGNADKPWAPLDQEDEYGHPLTYDEAQAVENLLGNVSAHDAEDAPERREQTPAIMCSQLKEYQKIGLTWLIKVLKASVFSRTVD